MPSPLFFHALIKKYIVQIRYKYGQWQDRASYKSLSQAERLALELISQSKELEARVVNRFTGQVVKTWPASQ